MKCVYSTVPLHLFSWDAQLSLYSVCQESRWHPTGVYQNKQNAKQELSTMTGQSFLFPLYRKWSASLMLWLGTSQCLRMIECWLQEKTWRKVTTWLSTYYLSTFCGEGFRDGSAARTHINTTACCTVGRTLPERFWARIGCWSCGGKGMPEAGKGVGQYFNRVKKIKFMRLQYSYYLWHLPWCLKVDIWRFLWSPNFLWHCNSMVCDAEGPPGLTLLLLSVLSPTARLTLLFWADLSNSRNMNSCTGKYLMEEYIVWLAATGSSVRAKVTKLALPCSSLYPIQTS